MLRRTGRPRRPGAGHSTSPTSDGRQLRAAGPPGPRPSFVPNTPMCRVWDPSTTRKGAPVTTGPDNAAASDGDGADGDPDGPDGPDGPDASGSPWTRRGLIAGVAAVGVGTAAALVTGAEPAGAADGSPVELGEENVASATTSIATSTGSGLDGSTGGSSGLSYGNAGVVGDSATTYGVIGVSSASSGVAGFATSDTASGVYGDYADLRIMPTSLGTSRSAGWAA